MAKQYIEGFPQATGGKTHQQVMAEWKAKYKFDTGAGKWYSEVADQPAEQSAEPIVEPPQQPTTPSGQSHMVASGDTLSNIALKYGTTVQELMAANPQISDPNMIYAGNTLSLPGEQSAEQLIAPDMGSEKWGETPSIPTLSFSLDDMTMGEFNTDDLINIFSSPITQLDIDKLLSENAKLRQDYLNSMKPTEQEIQLKSDLVDLRTEIDTERLAYKKGVIDIEQELVSMSTIMGGKKRLYDQTQLGMQTLALKESNLLTRLGMEVESREATQKALGVAMEFNEADIDRMHKMQNQIQQEKKDMFDIMSQFSVRAQNTLSIALDGLKGLDTGDLDADTIIKLQSLTKSAGIPFNVIQQALKVGKDEYEYDKYVQGLDTLLKEKSLTEDSEMGAIATEGLSPLAKSIVDGTITLKDITPTQRAEIAPELNAVGWTDLIKGEDKQTVSYIKNQMVEVMKKWNKIPDKYKGFLQGRWTTLIKSEERVPSIAEFNAAKSIVGMALTRLFEKGRISDEDRRFYLNQMPNLNQNKKSAEASSDELIRLLSERLKIQSREIETGNIQPNQLDKDYVNSLGL